MFGKAIGQTLLRVYYTVRSSLLWERVRTGLIHPAGGERVAFPRKAMLKVSFTDTSGHKEVAL